MNGVEIRAKVTTDGLHLTINTAIKGVLDGAQAGIEAGLKEVKDDGLTEGDPITYPVQWDSERQRRAYFATNGFGHGIPYHRTGGLVAGYVVTPLGDGMMAKARISNAAPAARYVVGDSQGMGQSRIHRGRWKVFRSVVLSYADAIVGHVRREIQARVSKRS